MDTRYMPYKDKDDRRGYDRRRYHERRRRAFERLGNRCVRCGGRDGLEIDHIDPAQKVFSVSRMWTMRGDVFWAEIAKCQLLCHEHHVEKTLKDRGFNSRRKHGTFACYRYSKCRCDKCRAANASRVRGHRFKTKASCDDRRH